MIAGLFTLQVDGRRIVFSNRITREGVDNFARWLFDTAFNGGTGPTFSGGLRLGLIANGSFSGVSELDTMASHAGWLEETRYAEAARPGPLAPTTIVEAAGTVASGSMIFTTTAAFTFRGLLVSDDSTKGGTSGKLWATALLGVPIAVGSGAEITASYTLRPLFTAPQN